MAKGRQSPAAAKRKKPKAATAKGNAPRIDATMNVMDAIALHPGAAGVLSAYGLNCFQCAFNTLDSIDAGARSHGLTDVDIDNIVIDLQELIDSMPVRPATLVITEAAAKALRDIQHAEGKEGGVLRVHMDERAKFCMEFEDAKKKDDLVVTHPDVAGVTLVASPDALWRIGGATIDMREGRFKLDMDTAVSCGCEKTDCACKSA